MKDIDALAKVLEPNYIRELPTKDAWGTPFRYETKGNTYRIISAGSDKKFKPATWNEEARPPDTAADAVIVNNRFSRLLDLDSGASETRRREVLKATTLQENAKINTLPEDQRMPYFWKWTTVQWMDDIARALEKYATEHKRYPAAASIETLKTVLFPDYVEEMHVNDGWRTHFRYSVSKNGKSYTLVSAGTDHMFHSETWTTAGKFASDAEDAVIRNGKRLREWQMLE